MKRSKRKKSEAEKVLPSPNWTLDMGVSYSLLSRFVNCRERFRLYAVNGMREASSSQDAMNFGTYFHRLLEIHAKDTRLNAASVIRKVSRSKKSINAINKTDRLMANMIFEEYLSWYEDVQYRYLDSEVKFNVLYPVAGAGKIRLVGKVDEIIDHSPGIIKIQENKTKETISTDILDHTIPFNLQTMMYVIAMEKHYNKQVGGIIYNVIRKPKHKQKKGETEIEFVERVRGILREEPEHFFHRWDYELTRERLNDFKVKTFDPLLRQFYVWWESIKHDPFAPWVDKDGLPNPHHFQRPFGVYDSLTLGKGDYFDLLTRGLKTNVTENNPPFQELQDD